MYHYFIREYRKIIEKYYMTCKIKGSTLLYLHSIKSKGRVPLPNRMNFWNNSKWPLTPPPHFWKIMLQIFYNGYGYIYARRYEGQIVWNACTCLLQSVSCFDFSQYNCWKNIPWTLNLLFLYQFHAQKALFKVPKICNINFWIED